MIEKPSNERLTFHLTFPAERQNNSVRKINLFRKVEKRKQFHRLLYLIRMILAGRPNGIQRIDQRISERKQGKRYGSLDRNANRVKTCRNTI